MWGAHSWESALAYRKLAGRDGGGARKEDIHYRRRETRLGLTLQEGGGQP
jgi:hypothetical protein